MRPTKYMNLQRSDIVLPLQVRTYDLIKMHKHFFIDYALNTSDFSQLCFENSDAFIKFIIIKFSAVSHNSALP